MLKHTLLSSAPSHTLPPSLPSFDQVFARAVLTLTRPTVKFKHSRHPYNAISFDRYVLALPSVLNILDSVLPQISGYDS